MVINSFRRTEGVFWHHLSQKELTLPHLHAYFTGVNIPFLNPVIQQAYLDLPLLEKYFQQVDDFYENGEIPWVWQVPKRVCSPEIYDFFQQRGLTVLDESLAMVYTCDGDMSSERKEGFVIKEIAGSLDHWAGPVKEAFKSTDEPMAIYLYRHQIFAQHHDFIKHYVGFYEEQPIASATLTLSPDGARLDDLAVCPVFQGQGYGKAILSHCLTQAKSLGAQQCFLEASQEGRGLYQKSGFRPILVHIYWGK